MSVPPAGPATVGPGDGCHVGLGLLGVPRQDPQQVGQPVQVREEPAPGQPLIVEGQRNRPALGPPQDGPGQLEGGRQPGLARDDELARELDPAPRRRAAARPCLDHRARHAGDVVAGAVPRLGVRRQLRTHHEQLALDAAGSLRPAPRGVG